jgi:hypothetical protein
MIRDLVVVRSVPCRTRLRTIFIVQSATPVVRLSTHVPVQVIDLGCPIVDTWHFLGHVDVIHAIFNTCHYPDRRSWPFDRRLEIWHPRLRHLVAIPWSGSQRSDTHNLASWHPSHDQTARDPTPMSSPLGIHPMMRWPKIWRPPVRHLATIQRLGGQRANKFLT